MGGGWTSPKTFPGIWVFLGFFGTSQAKFEVFVENLGPLKQNQQFSSKINGFPYDGIIGFPKMCSRANERDDQHFWMDEQLNNSIQFNSIQFNSIVGVDRYNCRACDFANSQASVNRLVLQVKSYEIYEIYEICWI